MGKSPFLPLLNIPDDTQASGTGNNQTRPSGSGDEEARAFEEGVITEPLAEVTGSCQGEHVAAELVQMPKKRKRAATKGVSKKATAPIVDGEGAPNK
ncbi:hypothetical protein LIER_01361 [Lithospermum erythrorhizon]|uniref:Uncharacterized protein n=1 Tax=Lithospermum erythrorhizon TaxID=34254 RepID=A0AAV3NQE5_LITER